MESLSKTSNALASLSINDKLIADIDEVEPRVFISNDKTANKLSILKAFNITHVLIVANGIETKFPKNFWYKVLPVKDDRNFKISKYFKSAIKFIEDALDENGTNNVLVHCYAGQSRSATIVAAYLIHKYDITFTEALQKIRQHRYINPNGGFRQQLYDFQVKVTGFTDGEEDI